MLRRIACIVGMLTVTGCAEPPFSLHVRDNNIEDINRALAASRAGVAAHTAHTSRAYIVTTAPKHLVAYDLSDAKTVWNVVADITSRVHVGRDFVVAREGTRTLVVRATRDGEIRCQYNLPQNEKLLGLAADDRVYYTSQLERTNRDAVRQDWLVAIDASSCAVSWRDEAEGSLGAPAVRGGVVAAPYAHQNAVLLDGKNGKEIARIRTLEEEINYVRAAPEGIFFGSGKDIFLVNQRAASGTKKDSATTQLHLAPESFRVFYYWDGYQPVQVDYTAFDRNRLLWRAVPEGDGITFRGGLAYLFNYRFIFALEAATGLVRWAYSYPRVDLVGADDVGDSILFASADGELGALNASSGVTVWSQKTGLHATGVTFDAEGFVPGPGLVGQAPPLTNTLTSIVWDPDARFTAIKVFVVDALAHLPGREVTNALLQIVIKGDVAPAVAARAGEALVARKDASMAAEYRAALAQHYDFLTNQKSHGIEYLARTASAIGDVQAVPLLGAQLLDGLVPSVALKDIVYALVALKSKDAIAPLRNFLLTYRCDPSFQADPSALIAAGEGLLTLGGAEEERLVRFVAEEPRTVAAVANGFKQVLLSRNSQVAVAPKAK